MKSMELRHGLSVITLMCWLPVAVLIGTGVGGHHPRGRLPVAVVFQRWWAECGCSLLRSVLHLAGELMLYGGKRPDVRFANSLVGKGVAGWLSNVVAHLFGGVAGPAADRLGNGSVMIR